MRNALPLVFHFVENHSRDFRPLMAEDYAQRGGNATNVCGRLSFDEDQGFFKRARVIMKHVRRTRRENEVKGTHREYGIWRFDQSLASSKVESQNLVQINTKVNLVSTLIDARYRHLCDEYQWLLRVTRFLRPVTYIVIVIGDLNATFAVEATLSPSLWSGWKILGKADDPWREKHTWSTPPMRSMRNPRRGRLFSRTWLNSETLSAAGAYERWIFPEEILAERRNPRSLDYPRSVKDFDSFGCTESHDRIVKSRASLQRFARADPMRQFIIALRSSDRDISRYVRWAPTAVYRYINVCIIQVSSMRVDMQYRASRFTARSARSKRIESRVDNFIAQRGPVMNIFLNDRARAFNSHHSRPIICSNGSLRFFTSSLKRKEEKSVTFLVEINSFQPSISRANAAESRLESEI